MEVGSPFHFFKRRRHPGILYHTLGLSFLSPMVLVPLKQQIYMYCTYTPQAVLCLSRLPYTQTHRHMCMRAHAQTHTPSAPAVCCTQGLWADILSITSGSHVLSHLGMCHSLSCAHAGPSSPRQSRPGIHANSMWRIWAY